jgi:hypothetical protein
VPVATSPQEGTRVAWNGVAQNPGGAFTMTQDIALPAGQIAQLRWKDRYQMNLSEFCASVAACGTATYTVQVLNTSNVVLQTLYSVTTQPLTNTNTGWVTHTIGLTGFNGQTIRLRFMDSVTVSWAGPGQVEIDAVSLIALPPTASEVNVGGRVTNSAGSPLALVTVTLTDGNGVIRTTTTGSMGYYNFENVPVSMAYFLEASRKGYTFSDNPRLINLIEEITDADFQASP